MTKLIEYKNHNQQIIRALFDQASSSVGLIFVPGFERTVVEYKFKNIVDKLKGKINLWRFDFSGCGLSDGDFSNTSVRNLTEELILAIKQLKKAQTKLKTINIVAHSLGACVALNILTIGNWPLNKMALLGPALNQKELLRYWFAQSQNKTKKISWTNYKKYFREKEFQADLKIKVRLRKAHYLNNQYFLENQAQDYQDLLLKINPAKIIIIHGLNDDKVPLASNNHLPNYIKIIKVKNGDHDLERPDMVKQYLPQLIKYLSK
jgi:pimeloyl-ACP methyl ester carboxylesterase